MKLSARTILIALVAGLFAVAAQASPPTVNPEPMDLDSSTNATIMKEKSKRRNMDESGGGDGSSSSSSNCGQVNINNNDKKSNSGLKDMFGKTQTTIVTGPVINMAKCK